MRRDFVLAIVAGLINGMGINGTTKVFIAGCSKMVNAAFIVGFANGISVILANGNILNTIVYWLSIPMSSMGSLAIAKTDWTKYAKWLMPLLGCQVILAFASLTILQSIGWTGL